MDSTDYNKERNTIINDGSFSILSIIPIGMTNKDAKQFLLNVKNICILASREYDFVRRTRDCAVGYTNRKSEILKHCSCFDIVDSFVGERNTISVPCSKKKKTNNSSRQKKRNGCMRMYIGTTYAKWCDKIIRIDIFLKLLLQKNVGIICFNLSLNGLSVEKAIALRHIVEYKIHIDNSVWCKKFSPSPEKVSDENQIIGGALYSLFIDLSEKISQKPKRKWNILKRELNSPIKKKHDWKQSENIDPLVNDIVSYKPVFEMQSIIELRAVGDFSTTEMTAHEWALQHAQMIYGLASGDEGVGFIPEKMAKERLENHWGSRDFFDMIAIGQNVIMLNSKTTSQKGKSYIDFQRYWNEKYNGGENRIQFFSGKPCIAGFDHGVLNAVERNMVIGFYYDFIDQLEKTNNKKLNKQRQQLISFITSSLSPIREINVMYDTISIASGIDKSIEQVRQKLNIQSEEMNIDYQYKNNAIIILLTVFSIAVAIVAIQDNTIFLTLKPWYKLLIAGVVILALIAIPILIVVNHSGKRRG